MLVNSRTTLRGIAVFKFLKAFCLLLVAVAMFGSTESVWLKELILTLERLPPLSTHSFLCRQLENLLDLQPRSLRFLAATALGYGLLFAVEGWGLWLGKRWAEYLTVIATGSLIPLELYEAFHHFAWYKLAALFVNVAVLIYLISIVRRRT